MAAGDAPGPLATDRLAAQSATLSVSVFGAVRAVVDGREVPIANRKAQALLAYLALHRDHQETREYLAGLLWSESASKLKRQNSLRHEISHLKHSLKQRGFAGCQFGRLSIALAPGHLVVDLWQVVASAEAHDPHPLLLNTPRLTESLLADLIDVDPDFRDWLTPTRTALHARIMLHLEEGLRAPHLHPTALRDDRRRRLAEAIRNLDPTHEEACRTVMRIRAENGDAVGAVRDYEILAKLLADEFDTVPEKATTDLYVAIKFGELEPAAPGGIVVRGVAELLVEQGAHQAPPAEPPARPLRINLLIEPFRQTGVEADRVHLLDGFRADLLGSLVRFREWSVTDGAAPANPPDAPAARATSYAVAATAYQAGPNVHVQITVRDRASGMVVWNNPFELTIETWFAERHRVMRGIATSLNVQMSAERLQQLSGQPDVALEVYDRWLRGQALMRPFKAENWNRAVKIFEDAIRDAPSFALAYSSLAQMNTTRHMVHPGTLRDRARAETTVELARKAVALDPLDTRAHLALGWAFAFADRHVPAAAAMEKACELNPYDAWTLISAALFHAYDGNPQEARTLADQSLNMTISPSPVHLGYQGTIQYLEGDYIGTIRSTLRASDIILTLPAWRAAAQFRLGHRDEAQESMQQFLTGVRARWQGAAAPTDAAIGHWLLQQFAISSERLWNDMRDGVIGAGLRPAPIRFKAW